MRNLVPCSRSSAGACPALKCFVVVVVVDVAVAVVVDVVVSVSVSVSVFVSVSVSVSVVVYGLKKCLLNSSAKSSLFNGLKGCFNHFQTLPYCTNIY